MSWIPGRAGIVFHSHPHSIELPLRNHTLKNNGSPSTSSTSSSLLQFCKDATPPCRLNPLLFNGHLQTFYTIVKSYDVPVYYKRWIFDAEDEAFAGTFAVDFAVPPYKSTSEDALPPRTTYYTEPEFNDLHDEQDSTPMLVVLHGLSGGSHELYLRHVLKPMLDAGWHACVVNSRGCAKSKITTGVLYNARATWDVRQIVGWVRRKYPKRPLFGMGFSLGANILVNYLGEEGDKCELQAAVVISNPWNLDVSALTLQKTWLGLEVYSKTMGSSMRALFEQHVEQISKNPRVNVDRVRKSKYLFEFDRELQGPTWGYPTEGAYYRDASSCDSLLAVRVPLFALNARDDPIAVDQAIPYHEFSQNPYTVLCTTSLGGHLSWFETRGGRWFVTPTCRFLLRMAEYVERPHPGTDKAAMPNGVKPAYEHASNYDPMRRRMDIRAWSTRTP